eukprot:1073182-Amphidinium_carterae.1
MRWMPSSGYMAKMGGALSMSFKAPSPTVPEPCSHVDLPALVLQLRDHVSNCTLEQARDAVYGNSSIHKTCETRHFSNVQYNPNTNYYL